MSKTLTPFENHLKEVMSSYETPYEPQSWMDLQKRMNGRSGASGAWKVAVAATVLVVAAAATGIYVQRNSPAAAQSGIKVGRFEKASELATTNQGSTPNAYLNSLIATSSEGSTAGIATTSDITTTTDNNVIANSNALLGSESAMDINTSSTSSNSSNSNNNQVVANSSAFSFACNMKEACEGVEVEFQISGPTEGSYLWNFGDGHFSSEVHPKHKFNKPGKYDVSLSITSNDGQIKTTVMDDMITIHPAPDASFEWDFVNEGSALPTVKILNTSEHATSYQWKFADGTTSNQVSPVMSVGNKGKNMVALEVRNEQGCTDATLKTISVNDGNFGAKESFNPAKESFLPAYLKQNKSTFHMSIYNEAGQKVFETTSRKGWDGSLPDGSTAVGGSKYTWKVIVTLDGSTDDRYYNGTLTINP